IIDAAGVRSHFDVRPSPVVRSRPDWYWRVLHRAERDRGLDDEEDLFTPGTVEVALDGQTEVVILAGTDPVPQGWDVSTSWHAAQQRQNALADPSSEHPLAGQLVVAGEQFRVARRMAISPPPLTGESQGGSPRTLIAGYHWFADWGRDTMISLPALAMRPGSLWEARAVLDTYITYLDHGLIPNRFPDGGEQPEYNTIDATLWLFQAVAAYLRASGDWRFIADRLEALEGIIDWHVGGTRHTIGMDHRDGLLAGGEEGDGPSLRPNQVIALALDYPLIEGTRARSALDRVTSTLLTPFGLRTLSPDDPRYQPSYQGDQRARDAVYHLGMAWPWLLGPYL